MNKFGDRSILSVFSHSLAKLTSKFLGISLTVCWLVSVDMHGYVCTCAKMFTCTSEL